MVIKDDKRLVILAKSNKRYERSSIIGRKTPKPVGTEDFKLNFL
tara:strand:+ start:756 stop:887 length:132 start_codon:yes stop_codon:yes gene_type:complete